MSNHSALLVPLFVSWLIGVAGAAPSVEQREIVVEITAPDSGWSIHINKVVQRKDGLFVVASLRRGQGAALMSLTKVRDQVVVNAPAKLPVRTFVLGKTWRWDNREKVVYVTDKELLDKNLTGGIILYQVDGVEAGDEAARQFDCVVILAPTEKEERVEDRARRVVKKSGGRFVGALPGVLGFRAELTQEQMDKLRKDKEVIAIDARRAP